MMNTFKKKSLYAAVLAGLGAIGVAGTASAVFLSPDHTGQVLIYPYYTAQTPTAGGTYLTSFSVVNSGATAKAVKVRFREAKNSREVLDFNVYMSPYDVWTGAVVATATGAKLVTTDTSCTVPAIPAGGVDFRNGAYTGAAAATTGDDGAGSGLDRTREGYFEMLELGVLTNATQIAWVQHGAGGAAPANCAAVVTNNLTMALTTPTNELYGGASIVNVATGTDYTYDASAFADFILPGGAALTTALGNELPNFTNGDGVSTVYRATAAGSDAVTSNWLTTLPSPSVNAISATIMHNNVMNEYVLDTDTLSGTDWVVNFPTKRYYVQSNNVALGGIVAGTATTPFQRTFWNGSCDDVTISYWDREEYANASSVDFSPSSPTGASLCWESNVVTFNNSNILGSAIARNIDVGTRQNGWANIAFRTGAGAQLTSTGAAPESPAVVHTYDGLPVIGFMVQDFTNQNAAPGVMATYGGNFVQKTTTLIAP